MHFTRINLWIQVFALVLALAPPTSPSKLTLHSSSPQTHSWAQIPLLHDHPFSCELVFLDVHQNKIQAVVTDLPKQIYEHLKLSLDIQKNGSNHHFQYEGIKTDNNNASFEIDLKSIAEASNFQALANITLSQDKFPRDWFQVRKVYFLFCEDKSDYIVKLPIKTMLVTQMIGTLFILLMPLNVQYRKFLPFTYNFISVTLYILILFTGLYLHAVVQNSTLVYQIQKYSVGIFQLGLIIAYLQDLMFICVNSNCITFVIAMIFSLAVLGIDLFGPIIQDAWFLNDLISIMVAGAFIKFVIIRKLKTAVWALALMWLFCFMREFAIQFGWQRFQQGLGYRVVPLFIQLPVQILDPTSTIICSAFGSSKIISFGVILNYCRRIDISLSTHFYYFLACLTSIICIAIEFIFNTLIMKQLPTSQTMSVLLFYPFIVGLLLFFSGKRGQRAQVWHGGFFDIAVNRSSIPRNVSFESIQSEFGKDLLTGSQISVDVWVDGKKGRIQDI